MGFSFGFAYEKLDLNLLWFHCGIQLGEDGFGDAFQFFLISFPGYLLRCFNR